jgi:tetratricopeptide (TPR) repeat protein
VTRAAAAALVGAALVAGGGCKRGEKAPSAPSPSTAAASPAPSARALYDRAKVELDAKAIGSAVADFTKATTMTTDPELRANAWLGLGAAYGELDDHEHAIAAYEQVTVLRPDDPDAWRVLAEGLDAAGRHDRQAAALEHVVALDPDDLSAYLDLAGLDAAVGKMDASKDVYLRYETRRREAVVQLGKSPKPEDRAAAAEALGGARDAGTARALVFALTDKDVGVRVACAQALGRIGVDIDPEVRPALHALMNKETDVKVRNAVDAALAAR